MRQNEVVSLVAVFQGIYYLFTGIWPILSRHSFEKLTEPKYDFWLVRTAGGLISVIGTVLALAGGRKNVNQETALLGIGSAASLAASDVIYASRGRISPVYGVEAVAEIGLIGLWLAGMVIDHRANRTSMLK